LKPYKECVRRQDASFEPLAASVGPTGWSVAVRKEKDRKNRRLTVNFAHAQPRPLWTDTKFCKWGRVVDVITDAKFYGNRLRGFGVTGQDPQTPFSTLNVNRLYNSVSTTVLHCDA